MQKSNTNNYQVGQWVKFQVNNTKKIGKIVKILGENATITYQVLSGSNAYIIAPNEIIKQNKKKAVIPSINNVLIARRS